MEKSNKTKLENRLKRIEGQVRGLQNMVEKDKYCIDIINQSIAVRSALFAVENMIMENHLSEHVIHQIKHGQDKKAVNEILSVYKKSNKR